MKQVPTILDTLESVNIFGPLFHPIESWDAWRVLLAAIFALPMTDEQLDVFQRCTGRTNAPTSPAIEAWLPIGRRGGKSRILALIAVYLAAFRDWRPHLAPGERGVVQVIATDRKQARSIFRYARALLVETSILNPLVENETAEMLVLANGIDIEITTSSFRAVRGYTIVAALVDEIAFLRTDEGSKNPDSALIEALRPAMATVPGALLLCASSPYARRGELWRAYKNHFGMDGDPILVWNASSKTMNPTVPQDVIDKAYERDPTSASAEYGAEFRTDVDAFLSYEVVEAVTVPGRFELPLVDGVKYLAFTDPSGGSQDSFALAIAHKENERVVLDLIREVRPPFSPEAVVKQFASIMKVYNVRQVVGDRYGGEWPRERFREYGIKYCPSDRSRSEIYAEFLPLMMTGQVELLDQKRLVVQLVKLERRTSRNGRDQIDHGPGGHDDVSNAAAGALLLASVSSKHEMKIGSPVSVHKPGLRASYERERARSVTEGFTYRPH